MNMPFVKTEIGANPIIVEAYFAASPRQVYRAWTEPEIIMKWFGPQPGALISAEADVRVGGVWQFVMIDDGHTSMGFEGTYLEIEPDRRLVLSWSKFHKSGRGRCETPTPSKVEIILTSRGLGTDIYIVHSAIDDTDTRIGFSNGWEHGIQNLYDLLEGENS